MSDTRQAIIEAATALFSERGYRGASVRDICRRAGASSNAINYHFGSKELLYKAVLHGFAKLQLELSERVLSIEPKSSDEFVIRLEVYYRQILDAYLENRETIRIISRDYELLLRQGEEGVVGQMLNTSLVIAEFIRRAVKLGFVASDVDPDIVAGLLVDRVFNQALFVDAHTMFFKVSTLDEVYREKWLRGTLRIVFNGICAPVPPAT